MIRLDVLRKDKKKKNEVRVEKFNSISANVALKYQKQTITNPKIENKKLIESKSKKARQAQLCHQLQPPFDYSLCGSLEHDSAHGIL